MRRKQLFENFVYIGFRSKMSTGVVHMSLSEHTCAAKTSSSLAEHHQIGNGENVDENERRAQNAHGVQNGHNLVAETRGSGKLVAVSPSQRPQKALLAENGHAVHKEHDAHQQLPRRQLRGRDRRSLRSLLCFSFFLFFLSSFSSSFPRTWNSPNMTAAGCTELGATPLVRDWTCKIWIMALYAFPKYDT